MRNREDEKNRKLEEKKRREEESKAKREKEKLAAKEMTKRTSLGVRVSLTSAFDTDLVNPLALFSFIFRRIKIQILVFIVND